MNPKMTYHLFSDNMTPWRRNSPSTPCAGSNPWTELHPPVHELPVNPPCVHGSVSICFLKRDVFLSIEHRILGAPSLVILHTCSNPPNAFTLTETPRGSTATRRRRERARRVSVPGPESVNQLPRKVGESLRGRWRHPLHQLVCCPRQSRTQVFLLGLSLLLQSVRFFVLKMFSGPF